MPVSVFFGNQGFGGIERLLSASSNCPWIFPWVRAPASLTKVVRCRIADRRGERVSFRQWMRLNIVAVCATNCGDRFDLCLSFRRYCYLLRRLRWC